MLPAMHQEEHLELPHTHECFVCGESNVAGTRVRFTWEQDHVVTRVVAREEHCGYRGIVHGGVLSALVDEAMGWAPAYVKKRMAVTGEMTVRFVKSVPVGTRLVITGRFAADRKLFWETEGAIKGEDGTVYVTAKAKYVPLTADESARVDRETLLYPDGAERLFLGST
jgi:uncharacterized protein (TIGR00369 family)